MSEWLKEHAWKTTPATLTERYRNTSSRNRFNDFPPQNTSRCEPVNVGVCRVFEATLHSFYTVLSGTSELRTSRCALVRVYIKNGPTQADTMITTAGARDPKPTQ